VTRRVIARLYLPLGMGATGRVLKAIAREWPDATVTGSVAPGADLATEMAITADPDLSRAQARAVLAERRRNR
jgi:hypothetical protein